MPVICDVTTSPFRRITCFRYFLFCYLCFLAICHQISKLWNIFIQLYLCSVILLVNSCILSIFIILMKKFVLIIIFYSNTENILWILISFLMQYVFNIFMYIFIYKFRMAIWYQINKMRKKLHSKANN